MRVRDGMNRSRRRSIYSSALVCAGAMMLVGALLPGVEILGEAASLFHLARVGVGWPWLPLTLLAPALLLGSALVPRIAWRIAFSLTAAGGPLLSFAFALHGFGPVVWLFLRVGGRLFLLGAVVGLLAAMALAFGGKSRLPV